MRHRIENEWITAEVDTKGAELKSLYSKKADKEYLWQGDPAYWGRTAPTLFPIVGKLQDDKYTVNEKEYTLSQHGFARDKEFELVEQSDEKLSFTLESDAQTKEHYPFDFRLTVTYAVKNQMIEVQYAIDNVGGERMYFSIGGHPGFRVPMSDATSFEDYVVSVQPKGERERIPLSGPYADLENSSMDTTLSDGISLSYPLFDRDALIYKMEGRNDITIHSKLHDHFVRVSFENFPFLGIWTPPTKEAPFLCIEPWHGLADTVDATGELSQKTGIRFLEPGCHFQTSYRIEIA